VARRSIVHASLLALCGLGCATAPADGDGPPGRTVTRGKPTSGYQVREAAEVSDTDGLQLKMEQGLISQDAAQQAVMARWKELTRCYGEAGPAMAFAGGPVTLRFMIDAEGNTADVRVVDTRLGNFEVERCLVTVGRTVRFPRPQGNAAARVDYSLEFRPTGAIGVVDLPDDQLDAELPGLFAQLAGACDKLGAEQVQATIYVDAVGAVRSVGLASEEAIDDQSGGCVSGAIRRWSVRAVVAGGVGRVTVALRGADLLGRGAPSPEVRRYSRASATARARARRGRR
jgi:hypothetical protein